MDLVTDDLAAVCDWASPERPVVLAGLSFGGLASLHYALRRPDRVRALVLAGSGPGFKNEKAAAAWAAQTERTARYLEERGYQTAGLRSQSWHDLDGFEPDRVVTVCDSAAGEACPLWMGEVEKHHWGLPDPSRVEGDDEVIRSAFMAVIDRIENKIDEWVLEAQS